MQQEAPVRCVAGSESYVLETRELEVAITRVGAMLAPATFFRDSERPVQPYAILPWHAEVLPADTPPLIAGLRGDFLCSAFGANEVAHAGRRLPLHGETCQLAWEATGFRRASAGCALSLRVMLPLQGGQCTGTTVLREGDSLVYQRHDFSGIEGGFINPGHHAILQLPDEPGVARLSFSAHRHAHTYIEPAERPEHRGYSLLRPDTPIVDLTAVPCNDGSTTDLTRYPARRGYDDVAIVCADPARSLAWSAVTLPSRGFAWFSLRNAAQLASTVLWSSNGGRHYPPWSGRCLNVLGVEDVTGFFHVGLAASSRPNILEARGIRTALPIARHDILSIPYIQGVARVPPEFDAVADITFETSDSARLTSASGVSVSIACHGEFLRTGGIPQLLQPWEKSAA